MDLETPEVMMFGKYKGCTYDEIPASYFLWLYDQKFIDDHPMLKEWIDDNLEELDQDAREEEYDATIWDTY